MQVNANQIGHLHLFTQVSWSSTPVLAHVVNLEIAHFVLLRIMVSLLEYRAATEPHPTSARW